MSKRNPDSPWNPAKPAHVTPEEYEKQVVAWLSSAGGELSDFRIQHRKHLIGSGGDYEFDAIAEFTALGGAEITVLVECKRYSRPVEREDMLVVWAKLQDVKAHKAIVFATCGFQSGALQFASSHKMGSVTFVEGASLWETRGATPRPEPPPWVGLPRYAGILFSWEEGKMVGSTLLPTELGPLASWLGEDSNV